MLALRPPRPAEAPALTELCLRSKAVWGYDGDFMRACRPELTVTPEAMRATYSQVAEIAGSLVGVVQITPGGATAWLDKLFVEPTRLRSGIGRELFDWARTTAGKAGAVTLVIDADPDAAGFHRRMGAVADGTVASGSVPGRFIPRLKLRL